MSELKNRPLHVFLCHAVEDKTSVRLLNEKLKREGWIESWLDEEKILPGQDWHTEIEKAIETTDVVIVCMSEASLKKEGYVQRELKFILDIADEKLDGTIFVVPLKFDKCSIPRRLHSLQYVDYFPRNKRNVSYEKLMRGLKSRAKSLGIDFARDTNPSNKSRNIDGEENALMPHTVGSLLNNKRQMLIKALGVLLGISILIYSIGFLINSSALNTSREAVVLAITPPSPTPTSAPTRTSSPTRVPTNTPSTVIISTLPSTPVVTQIGMDGMVLINIPEGEFTLGSMRPTPPPPAIGYLDEWPFTTLPISSFWIDQTEITNEMFSRFLNENGNILEQGDTWLDADDIDVRIHLVNGRWQADSGYEDHPVVEVTWYGAKAYCEWVGRNLPTEAQWERAAGGDSTWRYPWGDEFGCEFSNVGIGCDEYEKTSPVDEFAEGQSIYGVLNLSGNVWEWVSSLAWKYPYEPLDGRENLNVNSDRIIRGGSWRSDQGATLTVRKGLNPIYADTDVGFRCAISK
jgi:formylglycine-generating enzyme required for sulfatase activity